MGESPAVPGIHHAGGIRHLLRCSFRGRERRDKTDEFTDDDRADDGPVEAYYVLGNIFGVSENGLKGDADAAVED